MTSCIPLPDTAPVLVDNSTAETPPDIPGDGGPLVFTDPPAGSSFSLGGESSLPPKTPPTQQISGGGTLGSSMNGQIIESMSDTPVTFTIDSSIAGGTIIELFQYGAGQVTIATAGPTILSDGGRNATTAQYATIGIRIREGGGEAVLSGDLTAV